MALNILIFLVCLPLYDNPRELQQFYFDWALIPARLSAAEAPYTLLTSMFLHGGWMHIIGNMLFLFIYGDNVEDEMGHIPFLGFYLLSGLAAGLLQYATEPGSLVPMVGASGAIAGVMGAYLLFFPRARVDVFIFLVIIIRILPIPAWILLGLWFAMQFFGGLSSAPGSGGVAYWAHAGGFLAGIALAIPLWLRRGATAFWKRNHGHPPHPEVQYSSSRLPKIRRR
jgi:membrane associated rhomboid family serine protease